jgi:hypothetical protein
MKLPTVTYRKVYTVSAHVHMLSVTLVILPFLQWANVQALRELSLLNPLNAELNPICHLLALLGAHLIFHISRIRVKMQVSSGRLWSMFISTKMYHAFTNHALWKEYCRVFVTKDLSWICLSLLYVHPPNTHLNLQFITIIIHDVEYNNKGSSLCIFLISSVYQNLLIRNMSHLNE